MLDKETNNEKSSEKENKTSGSRYKFNIFSRILSTIALIVIPPILIFIIIFASDLNIFIKILLSIVVLVLIFFIVRYLISNYLAEISSYIVQTAQAT